MTTKTGYPGIDYSCGMRMPNGKLPNVDSETGIRYGVIHSNSVLQAWCDSSEPEYPCSECKYEQGDDDCGNAECEAIAWNINTDGYIATQGSDGDIFVIKSPFYTYAQFCSPCAPGACHLSNPLEDPNPNNKCYCFKDDWFDSEYEPCPYPVYDLKTDKLVYTPTDWNND